MYGIAGARETSASEGILVKVSLSLCSCVRGALFGSLGRRLLYVVTRFIRQTLTVFKSPLSDANGLSGDYCPGSGEDKGCVAIGPEL